MLFVLYMCALEMVETAIVTTTYKSVNSPATNGKALRCAVHSAQLIQSYFTIDAGGNCLFTLGSGSQYKKTGQVGNVLIPVVND